jgi:hypothetical protein
MERDPTGRSPTPARGCGSRSSCSDTGEFRYLSAAIGEDGESVSWVADSKSRTWKLIERAGRVEQYVWHQPAEGEPGWTLTDERPPYEPGWN